MKGGSQQQISFVNTYQQVLLTVHKQRCVSCYAVFYERACKHPTAIYDMEWIDYR